MEEDPPTLDEIQTLREFAGRYDTSDTTPADYAARKLMSLADEGRVVDERQNNVVDKGERVPWLLWDAAIYRRYQPAILKLIEAIHHFDGELSVKARYKSPCIKLFQR